MLPGMRRIVLTAIQLEAREADRKAVYGVRRQIPKRQLDRVQQHLARVRTAEYLHRQRGLRRPDRKSLALKLLTALAQSSRAELRAASALIKRTERLLVAEGFDLEQSRDQLRRQQARLKS